MLNIKSISLVSLVIFLFQMYVPTFFHMHPIWYILILVVCYMFPQAVWIFTTKTIKIVGTAVLSIFLIVSFKR